MRSKAKQEIETSFYRAGAAAEQAAQTEEDTEATMNAKRNSIEQQLYAIRMSEHERNAALHAAQIAERFVGAIEWVCRQAGRFGETGFAKPSPKY